MNEQKCRAARGFGRQLSNASNAFHDATRRDAVGRDATQCEATRRSVTRRDGTRRAASTWRAAWTQRDALRPYTSHTADIKNRWRKSRDVQDGSRVWRGGRWRGAGEK